MTENTENKHTLVAVDDGYAQTKLYSVDDNGKPVRFCMRSSVRPGRYGLGSISGEGNIGLYETDEDGAFTVSEAIEAENTMFDGFHVSTMNRVLVNHALVAGGYAGEDVSLMTGLPVADFFINGFKDEAKIAEKRANLLKEVRLTSGDKRTAHIRDVRVGCQAVAAWVDYALDDDLNLREEMEGVVAIVDIGGRTTDIATVIDGQQVDHARSGTANIGVLSVYEALQNTICSNFKVRDRFPVNQLDAAVRTKKIKLWGSEEDVSDAVADVVKEQQSKIVREIERRIGSGASMSAVVFVGGGSALFSDIANSLRNGRMAEDPEYANARGLFKFAKYQEAE